MPTPDSTEIDKRARQVIDALDAELEETAGGDWGVTTDYAALKDVDFATLLRAVPVARAQQATSEEYLQQEAERLRRRIKEVERMARLFRVLRAATIKAMELGDEDFSMMAPDHVNAAHGVVRRAMSLLPTKSGGSA